MSDRTWVLDCDGVIWLADEPIPGAADTVKHLRASGVRVVFLTNNSHPTRSEHLAKLDRMGMTSDDADLISSPMAAASLLQPGDQALVLGGPGVWEALAIRSVEAFEPGDVPVGVQVDAVVVGFDLKFDFARLAVATTALRSGARLIATNDDATFPSSAGLWPGAGSFVAAVSTAGGVKPEVAGKPCDATVKLVGDLVGDIDVVVGDRPSTDGLFAQRIGADFGLVLSGVTPADHGPVDPTPAAEAADLAALVDLLGQHR